MYFTNRDRAVITPALTWAYLDVVELIASLT